MIKLKTMKKTNFLLGVVLMCIVAFFSCGNEAKEGNESQTRTTEVPDVLTSNNDVTEYLSTLDLFMEEYLSVVESMLVTAQKTEDDDLGFGDLVSMTTDVAGSAIKMAPLLERLEELESEADVLMEDMDAEELEAFMKTYTKMMIRIAEIGEKLN